MNRLSSLFKRRSTMPIFASFSTNTPRVALAQQSNMSPTSTLQQPSPSASPESYGNFDLIERVKLSGFDFAVSRWRSRMTGLKLVHLDYEGKQTTAADLLPLTYIVFILPITPIMNGYFVVTTESTRIFASVKSYLMTHTVQFSMTRVVCTRWSSEYTLDTNVLVPDIGAPPVFKRWLGLYGSFPVTRTPGKGCIPHCLPGLRI